MIDVGDTFRLTATGTDDLKASTKLQILNPDRAVAQYLEIHTSCSKPLRLGDEFGALRVVGFVSGGERKELADPDAPIFFDQCSLPSAPPAPHCTSKPLALTFRYLGGDCSESTERQDGDNCSGSDPGAPVSITVTKDADKVSVSPSTGIGIGDTFTFSSADKLPNLEFDGSGPGGTQSIEIHTSCSQPIDLGDRFGAFEVFAIDREKDGIVSLGGVVEYQYTIRNPLDTSLTVIMATDNRLGDLIDPSDPIVLEAGGSTTLIKKGTVFEDTLNLVMVGGQRGSALCMDSDMVLVSVEPPPPAPFTCDKPIDELTMIWNDATRDVRVKAWKGDVGSTLLADVDDVSAGDEVQVDGYAGSPNDVIWEIFAAGTSQKLGESKFHLSCSDDDMNGSEDCGKAQGNGKSDDSSLLNDWLLEGMVDQSGVLDCTPEPTATTTTSLSDRCGLGAELALLLPPLMALRRRKLRARV